jgi:hypothetical protein
MGGCSVRLGNGVVHMESLREVTSVVTSTLRWLIVTGCVTGCCLQPTSGQRTGVQPNDVIPTSYLTGPELAQLILRNVVLLDYPDRQEHGAGLVVGRDGGSYLIVTAKHVVSESGPASNTLFERVQVRFCADGENGKLAVGTPVPVSDSRVNDIALVRVSADSLPSFEQKVVASEKSPLVGEQAWIVGREGKCAIGGTAGKGTERFAVDEGPGSGSIISAYVPNSNATTSGAALVTARGVVGIVQDLAGAIHNVKATDIHAIRQVVQSREPKVWQIANSDNLPPTSPEAASRELNEVLVRYIFDAKTNHQTRWKAWSIVTT